MMSITVGWITESWWVSFLENGILLNEKQENKWVEQTNTTMTGFDTRSADICVLLLNY